MQTLITTFSRHILLFIVIGMVSLGNTSCRHARLEEHSSLVNSECIVDIVAFTEFYVHLAAEGEEIKNNGEAEMYLRGVRDPCELFIRGFDEMGTITFPPGSFMRCDRENSKILIRNTISNSQIILRVLADFMPGRQHSLPEPFDTIRSNGVQ